MRHPLNITGRCENAVPTLCDMCQNPIEPLKQKIAELQDQLDAAYKAINKFKSQDPLRQLMESGTSPIAKEMRLISQPYAQEVLIKQNFVELNADHPISPLITITFDPQKWKYSLVDKAAQRYYILAALRLIMNNYPAIRRITGCYELHENGRVHAHLLFQTVEGLELPNMESECIKHLQSFFTNKVGKQYALHIKKEPDYETDKEYIIKPATKDPEYGNNYIYLYNHSKIPPEIMEFISPKKSLEKNI